MMALKGLVTYHKSFETQDGNKIRPEFFCELELDLGHKKIKKDKEAIFTISGIGSFEMYFSGLVVQGENVRGISGKENLFSEKYDENDSYFPFTMDGASDSKFKIWIKKIDACTYEIKVESYRNCKGKLKLRLESAESITHHHRGNKKRLIQEFIQVQYSGKSTNNKEKQCLIDRNIEYIDMRDKQERRIDFPNSNNKDRLMMVHTKQFMTLAAISKHKPIYSAITKSRRGLTVTYVGPDDLTNMETSLNFIKEQAISAGVQNRRLFVRADILGEKTTHRKLNKIFEDFEGLDGTEGILQHQPSWDESDIIIDTFTINCWKEAPEYNDKKNSWEIFAKEISRRISALKPNGTLYLVFPNNISGFWDIFTEDYETIFSKDNEYNSEFSESPKSSWRTDRVLKELQQICTELKKKFPNITFKGEEFDFDGGYIVIRKGSSSHVPEKADNYATVSAADRLPSGGRITAAQGEFVWERGAMYPTRAMPIERQANFKFSPVGKTLVTINEDMGSEEAGKIIIHNYAEDFVSRFTNGDKYKVSLSEMDELIDYLNAKGYSLTELIQYYHGSNRFSITSPVLQRRSDDMRELIAAIIEPLSEIQERRDNDALSHYVIGLDAIQMDPTDWNIVAAAAA
jgi:hypothetical protein